MDRGVKIEPSAKEYNPDSEVSECTKTGSGMFQALDLRVKSLGHRIGDGVSKIGQQILKMDFERSCNVFDCTNSRWQILDQ